MTASALTLAPRAAGPSSSPAPISWPPSQYWSGDDGSWSSFNLRVGNPEQVVRVLISTASDATWVVSPEGCPANVAGITPAQTCSQSRGGLFSSSRSDTWSDLGNYSLAVETNLGYNYDGSYGLDTVALGLNNATAGSSLQGQVVAGLQTFNYFTGMFGLGDQPSNFTASSDATNLTDTIPHPSFLTTLKSQKVIPSLSWAYTAGAIYRLKGVFGSLTLGGYDLSRLIPNNVTFNLAPDISRDLLVGLQSITSTSANGSAISLLPSAILTFIDSTLPYIYLPLESCQEFERAFGLTWNETYQMYFVNDTLHQSLTARNPNFTFSIGNSLTGGPTVDIVLPYASFDLLASYPMVLDPIRYFPLVRGAANGTQYTLGRTFLQEAYLITNYEHSNFSVSQARFEDGLPKNIVSLPSADPLPTSSPHSHLGRKSIIGLSVGLTAFVILAVFLVYLTRRKVRKYLQKNEKIKSTGSPRFSQDVKPSNISALHEADNNSLYQQRELPDNGKVELLDGASPSGSGIKVSEMAQSPAPTPLYELQDGTSPSGSGNKVSEMPQSPATTPLCELAPTSLCELGTRHTSLATSSLRIQSDLNRNAIFVKRGFLRESSQSSRALKESPCVETVISSSPRHESLALDKQVATPPGWTFEYLNRALPSLPSSDSTSVSPTKTGSSSRLSVANGIHSLSSKTSVTSSSPASAPSHTSLDMNWKDYDMSWESDRQQSLSQLSLSWSDIKIMIPTEVLETQMHEDPSSSSLSSNLEIVIPPGTPESKIPSSASSPRKGNGGTGDYF